METIEDTATPWLFSDSPRAFRISLILYAMLILIIGAIAWCLTPYPLTWGHDLGIFLDGAWRIHCGQRPHSDFYSPLGPLPFYFLSLGLSVGSPSVAKVFEGTFIFYFLIAIWAWMIARPRLPAASALIISLSVSILVISPRPLGFLPSESTYAMLYNRWGESILCLVVLQWFLSPIRLGKPIGSRRSIGTCLSVGILLSLLLLIKISYFLVGYSLVAIFEVSGWRSAEAWKARLFSLIALTAAIFCATSLFFAVTNIGAYAFVEDMRMVSQAQDLKSRLIVDGTRVLSENILLVGMVAILLFLPTDSHASSKTRVGFLPKFFAVILIVSGLLLCTTNYQIRDIPLWGTSLIVFSEYFRRENGDQSRIVDKNNQRLRFILSLPLVISLPILDCWGLATVALYKHNHKPRYGGPSLVVNAEPLRDILISTPDLVDQTNSGIRLIQKNRMEGDHLLVLDFVNPFSFATGMQPPFGDALWWHSGKTFSLSSHLTPERVLDGVDLILVPTVPIQLYTTDLLKSIYGKLMDEEFIEIDKSQYWLLLRKRSALKPKVLTGLPYQAKWTSPIQYDRESARVEAEINKIAGFQILTSFTLTAKVNAFKTADFSGILSLRADGPDDYCRGGVVMQIRNQSLGFESKDLFDENSFSASVPLTPGWHNLAVVVTYGEKIQLFIDERLVTTKVGIRSAIFDRHIFALIGERYVGDHYKDKFDGLIQDASIYNWALSPEELRAQSASSRVPQEHEK